MSVTHRNNTICVGFISKLPSPSGVKSSVRQHISTWLNRARLPPKKHYIHMYIVKTLACFQVHSRSTHTLLFVISVNTHPHPACFFIQKIIYSFLGDFSLTISFIQFLEIRSNLMPRMEMMRAWGRLRKTKSLHSAIGFDNFYIYGLQFCLFSHSLPVFR